MTMATRMVMITTTAAPVAVTAVAAAKGEGNSAVSEYYDVVGRVDKDNDEYNDDDDDDDNDDDGNGRRDDGKSEKVEDDHGDSDDDAGRRGNRPTSKSAAVLTMDGVTKVRGMSSNESSQVVQIHVAFRVRLYVQNDLFRQVKFINNDWMLQTAMNMVMDHKSVPQNVRHKFQMLYESTFNVALNQKRSDCEQAGGKLVRTKMEEMKKNGEKFYTMEELCKLQGYGNEREQLAFYWFFSSFFECGCGANPWRALRHKHLMLKAIDPTTQEKL